MGILEHISERKVTTPIQKHLWATMNICHRHKIRALAQKTRLF